MFAVPASPEPPAPDPARPAARPDCPRQWLGCRSPSQRPPRSHTVKVSLHWFLFFAIIFCENWRLVVETNCTFAQSREWNGGVSNQIVVAFLCHFQIILEHLFFTRRRRVGLLVGEMAGSCVYFRLQQSYLYQSNSKPHLLADGRRSIRVPHTHQKNTVARKRQLDTKRIAFSCWEKRGSVQIVLIGGGEI